MTGKLRYLLAAVFLALLFVAPSADRHYLGLLQTRSWLVGSDSPLPMLREGQILGTSGGRLTRVGAIESDRDGRVRFDDGTPVFRIRGGLLEELPKSVRLVMDRKSEKLLVVGEDGQRRVHEPGGMLGISWQLYREDRRRDYERIHTEWARGQGLQIEKGLRATINVLVGDRGTAAEPRPFTQITVTLPNTRGKAVVVAQQMVTSNTDVDAASKLGYYPDNWSLLPAFLAIALAILTGKVIPSLLLGCLAGSLLFAGFQPILGLEHFLGGTLKKVLLDDFKLEIMGFVIFLFMAVGVMTRSGGVQGMINRVSKMAKGPISSQLTSYVIGILVFFDDYTNCVLTGTTMRPLTDRNGVSREKLSYIVDSTAAPIAAVSLFSTWIAYEISMFAPQLPEVMGPDGTPYREQQGFDIFLQTIPFRFYCLFTLIMVPLTIVLRREFGPMLTAERRARHEGKPSADDARPLVSSGFQKLEPPSDIPHRAINAVLPLIVLVTLTIGLIIYFGLPEGELTGSFGDKVRTILGNTDSTYALLFASAGAFVVASLLTIGQRVMTPRQVGIAAGRSASSLGFAVIILILAWSIGETCGALGTNQYLTAAFSGTIEPWLLPTIMFGLASLVSFSTGTSYGTMAILLPNVVVLAHTMGEQYEGFGGPALMVLTIGAVLEGSIFGDHCSPISDTTVLSSVATGSDHLHHVRTQAPYAVFVMIVSMVCGYLPVALLGTAYWPLAWALGIGALLLGLVVLGRRP